MTSRTGTPESGFSMIELMVTVVFVTLGSFLIQGSFLRSAEMFGRYSHTLKLMGWMDERSAQVREKILSGDPQGSGSGSGVVDGKPFSWTREVESLDTPHLNTIRYTVRWEESGKPTESKNEQYVYKNPLGS